VCGRIKAQLLEEFNLHTIIRLPNGVFAPYTSIPTNLLFFDRSGPTKDIWYYEQPLPEGRKNYTKTQPMQFEEFAPCLEWWKKRAENGQAWKVKAQDVLKYDEKGALLSVNRGAHGTSRRHPNLAMNPTLDDSIGIQLYERMVLIRKAEEKLGRLFAEGSIPGFVHLSIGQEAVLEGRETDGARAVGRQRRGLDDLRRRRDRNDGSGARHRGQRGRGDGDDTTESNEFCTEPGHVPPLSVRADANSL